MATTKALELSQFGSGLILDEATNVATLGVQVGIDSLTVNGTERISSAGAGTFSSVTLSGGTASTALALDANKNIVSVTNTGTGSNVLANSPTFSGTILSGGDVNISSTTASTEPFYSGPSGPTGALRVAGGASVAGDLFVGKSLNVYPDPGVSSGASQNMYSSNGFEGSISFRTDGALKGQIGIGTNGADIYSYVTNGIRLFNNGVAGLTIDNANIVRVLSNSSSTSTTTGALRVAGGVGIVGNLYVGGTVSGVTATHVGLGNVTNESKATMFANPSFTGDTTLAGELRGPATFVIDPAAVGDNTGVVVIKGDLQVDGTTTTINSTTLTVDDKNIVLADGSANAAAADGAGITVAGANATLTYASTGDKWSLNKPLDITGALNVAGNVTFAGLTSTGIDDNATQTSLTISPDGQLLVGTTTQGYVNAKQTNRIDSSGIVTGLVLQNGSNEPANQGVQLIFKNSIYNGGGIEDAKHAFIRYLSESNYGEQGALVFGTNDGYGINPSERLRIKGNGQININGSGDEQLNVNGSIGAYFNSDGNGGIHVTSISFGNTTDTPVSNVYAYILLGRVPGGTGVPSTIQNESVDGVFTFSRGAESAGLIVENVHVQMMVAYNQSLAKIWQNGTLEGTQFQLRTITFNGVRYFALRSAYTSATAVSFTGKYWGRRPVMVYSNNANLGVAGETIIASQSGMYPLQNSLTLQANGGEALRIDSSRRIGIGTSNPTGTLQVTGLQANTSDTSVNSPSGTLRLDCATDGTEGGGVHGASLVFSQRWWNGTGATVATGQIASVKFAPNGQFGGGLTFWTSDGDSNSMAERMRINQSGVVTIPSQPSWCLRPNGNGNDTVPSSEFIGWTNNTSNTSNKVAHITGVTLTGSASGIHQATTSGRLTVPVAGKYKMWVTIRGENFPSTGNIYLFVNGAQVARQHVESWGPTHGYPFAHGFLELVLNLSANDYIETRVDCPGLVISGYYDTVNWFAGHLIG
jgi:hypothetical protein